MEPSIRTRIPVPVSGERIAAARPSMGRGRLGLAAILGLIAGAVLFPTPAKGRTPVQAGANPAGGRTRPAE